MRRVSFFALCLSVLVLSLAGAVYAQNPTPVPIDGPYFYPSYNQPSPLVANAQSTVVYLLDYTGMTNVTLVPANITLNGDPKCRIQIGVIPGTAIYGVMLDQFTGDGDLSITLADGTATDAGGLPAAGGDGAPFRVDTTKPTPTITLYPGQPASVSARPTTMVDGRTVSFKVEFTDPNNPGETIRAGTFDASDVTVLDINGDDDTSESDPGHEPLSIFSSVFPGGGHCYDRANNIVVTPEDDHTFRVDINPRRDCDVRIRINANVCEDGSGDVDNGDPGNPNNASDTSPAIAYDDAPRVYIRRLSGDSSNASTLNFRVEFSEPLNGNPRNGRVFGPDDVKIVPVSVGGTAGGSKSVVVTGSGDPLSGGSIFNVAISGMTYSGTVEMYLDAGAASRLDLSSQFSWESEGPCVSNVINYDGTVPDDLTVTLPAGLAPPPASADTYTTNIPLMDIAGTAHDDVGITQVTWSNNRGGSSQCNVAADPGSPDGLTFNWDYSGIILKPGENIITISAYDAAGNHQDYVLTVNCASANWVDRADSTGGAGQHTSIALDASGNPRVAYYQPVDASHGRLMYAVWDGQTWDTQKVDGDAAGSLADDVGQYTSLKLDSLGNPHISYYDVTNTSLKYAYLQDGAWRIQSVDGTGANQDFGKYSSLALDSTGRPRISYYDATNGDLRYAQGSAATNPVFTKSIVESAGDVGQYSSLALDGNGLPRIAYYDATNGQLRYAEGSAAVNPTWFTDVVDTVSDTGRYCSLALNSAGLPRIAYYDVTGGDLKYAEGDGPVSPIWTFYTIDSAGNVGSFASLRLHGLDDQLHLIDAADPLNDRPRIAYYDATNGDLKYAVGNAATDPAWSTSTLDGMVAESGAQVYDVGQFCSLCLDSSGDAHISYYDATAGLECLRYLFVANGPSCTVTGPASPTNSSSITFDITFSSEVTGLEMSEIQVSGCTKSTLTPGPTVPTTTYQLVVAPTISSTGSDTTVTCRVPFGVARAGTRDNLDSNTAQVIYDGTLPTVVVNQDYIQRDPTNTKPIQFSVVFSEPVTGFKEAQFPVIISGSAGGTKTVTVEGTGTHYQVYVNGMTTAGTVIATVPANVATDAAGNRNVASTSSDATVWYDGTAPTCTINQAAEQADPTSSDTINFTAVFSEPVVNFSGVTITGSASFINQNGQLTRQVVISPTGTPDAFGHYRTYTVSVSGMTTRGTVIASIPAGAAFDCDSAGVPINANTASTSTDNIVQYDATPPTVTINQKSDQVDPTNTQPIRYTVVFSKAVTGFDKNDVQITGTADLTSLDVSVTGSGTTYTVEVRGIAVPAGQTGPVTVIANIPPGVAQDDAGNGNLRATTDDNTVYFDDKAPTVTVEQAVGQTDSTRIDPVNFTVTFSEPVTGFTAADVTLGGTVGYVGVPSVTVTDISGNNGTMFRVAVGGFDTDQPGSVTAMVPAGVAQDALGNLNEASTSLDNKMVFFPEQCSGTHVTIPDNTPAGAESSIDLSGASGIITDLNVKLSISHAYDQDLKAYLIGPDDTQIELFTNVGGNGSNFTNTILDDEATQTLPTSGAAAPFTGSWKAKGLLSAFDNKDLNGLWRLKLVDSRAGVQGTLLSWCLQFTIQDTQAPTCTISYPELQTNNSPIDFTIQFSEPVSTLDLSGITVTGGAADSLTPVGADYTLSVTPAGDGPVGVRVNAGAVHDTCGNPNTETTFSVTYDSVAPTAVVTAVTASPTNSSVVNYTAVFSEPVYDLTSDGIAVQTGGTTAFQNGVLPVVQVTDTGDHRTFNIAVSGMNAGGSVAVRVGANAAHDMAGNYNALASNQATVNFVGVICTVQGPASPTNTRPITFNITFTAPVSGLTMTSGKISVTGGTMIELTPGSGVLTQSYTLKVNPTGDGTVTCQVLANAAKDAQGNNNSASNVASVVYDGTRVDVTINQGAGQSDPANALPITYTVVFSEPVNDFAAADVAISGSAGGTKTVAVTDTGDHQTYTVTVNNVTDGTVIASIAADVAHDAAGNGNNQATFTDNTVVYDTGRPSVSIRQAPQRGSGQNLIPAQVDPTNSLPIRFTADFSENVTGFAADDVIVTGTAPGQKTVTVTEINQKTYDIAIDGVTGSGTVVVSIPEGAAQDGAGNTSQASTVVDNSVSYEVGQLTVSVDKASGQADPTNALPIYFTIIFNKPVVTTAGSPPAALFSASDVDITGTFAGTPNKQLTDTGDHKTFTLAVSNITCQPGSTLPVTVAASIRAGQTQDQAGNPNVASTSTDNEVIFDNQGPTVTVEQAAGQNDSSLTQDGVNTIKFIATFSEPVNDFTAEDVTIGGSAGYVGNPVKTVTDTDGNKTVFSIVVSGIDQSKPGSVIASIAAGKANDALNNPNTASTSTDNRVVYFPTQCSTDAALPLSIPDNDSGGGESTLDLTGYSGVISDLNVTLDISHDYDQDLTAILISPNGTQVQLFSEVGGSGSGFHGTLLNDEAQTAISAGGAPFSDAGGYRPAEQLSAFDGENITGIWRLKVIDNSAGQTGMLNAWCLQLRIADSEAPTCTITAPASPVKVSPVNFTTAFSEPVVGLVASDFTVTGGTATGLTGSGTTYTLAVTPNADGLVTCTLDANKAHDTCGNYNAASASASVTYSGTPPTVTINQATGQADPTRQSPINFTAAFSEAIVGFTSSDVAISGTAFGAGATKTATITSAGGNNYNVAVSGMNQSGTVTVSLPAGVVTDADGNGNLASTSTDNTVTYDITKPTVTVSRAAGQDLKTVASPINFAVVFSKPVTGFTNGDVTVTGTAGGTKTVTVTGNGTTYNVAVALSVGASAGSVIVSIPAGAAQDALGNLSAASTGANNIVWYDDGLAPTVTINQAAGQDDPTNADEINFTVVFSKPVNDFASEDVTLTTTSGDTLTTVVTPNDGGEYAEYNVAVSGMTESQVISATIGANKAHDTIGGLGNAASTSTDNQITYDNQAPSVTINQAAGQADPTSGGVINFTATFTEAVTGFTGADVSVTGTAFGAGAVKTVVVTQTGATTYNVAVSGMTVSGTVFATIPAGGVTDVAGNANLASTSVDNSVTYDTPPTVTVAKAAAQADPTNGAPVSFQVAFSEPVVGFVTGKAVVSGTAFGSGATAVGTITGGPAVYNVAVSGMTRSGTVIVSIPAGAAKDLGGNDNIAAPASASVQYDITQPTVTINQAAGQADPVSASPILFTVVFSEPVSDFTGSDVTVTGTAGGTKTVTVTGSGTTYTASVGGMTSSGTVIASLAAGVAHDAAGNGNTASTSTDHTVTYDVTGPTVTVNQAADQADPTNDTTVKFTVVFSKPVTDFSAADVTITGTAGGTKTVAVTGSGTTYTVTVSGLTSTGTVVASVEANKAHDSLGNGNMASTGADNTVTFDNSGPSVTVAQASGQADPTRQSPINFTVVFSKPVTGFTSSDVTIGGTSGAKTAVVTGSGTTYNVAVSGMTASGVVTLSVAAGAAHDSAGNANSASTSTDNEVTYDDAPPAVSITEPTSEPACTRNVPVVKLSGSAEDGVGVAKVEWSTAKGDHGVCTGTTSWVTGSITIPGGEDTVTVVATDTSGNTSTDTLTIRVVDAAPGAAWNGLAMVALPIIPDEMDPKLEVNFLGDYWVMYKPDTTAYVKYPGAETWFNPASKTPGRGFWTKFGGAATTPAGVVPAQDSPVTIKLQAGWNLIGQPFIAPVAWNLTAIKVKYGSETRTLAEATDLGWIKDYAWGWQPNSSSAAGGAYYLVADPSIITGAVGEMAPWHAYWVKANIACDLVLPAP